MRKWIELQLQSESEQLFLFLAQIVASCSRNLWNRGGCPGAPGLVNSGLFDSWGVALFKTISGILFLVNWAQFWLRNDAKWSPNEVLLDLIFKKHVKMKKCVWTAPARTDCMWAHLEKHSMRQKNHKKTDVFQVRCFCHQKYKNVWKMTSQMYPNGWGDLGVWRLWGHLWRHYSKHVPKSAPKVVPRLHKCLQKGSKSGKSESQNDNASDPGPADCAKRLQ